MNSGYATNPDHQARRRSSSRSTPGPRDIIIAEDVLEQTDYLGHVDYWLQARNVAGPFVRNMNGVLKDFYTNTPLISTPEELRALIDTAGSWRDLHHRQRREPGRRPAFRARGRAWRTCWSRTCSSVVYRGRDNLTTGAEAVASGRGGVIRWPDLPTAPRT